MVQLSDDANEYVIADAVYIERLGDAPPGLQVLESERRHAAGRRRRGRHLPVGAHARAHGRRDGDVTPDGQLGVVRHRA